VTRSERWETVFGHELQVGDVLEVWWRPGRDTIMALTPYEGPLKALVASRMDTFARATGTSWLIASGRTVKE